MDTTELIKLAAEGAALAILIRILFRVRIQLHWAALIGACSVFLLPLLSVPVLPAAQGQAQLLTSGVVILSVLGVAQLLRYR